ncbi:LapA family protein [Erythrobacter crassostreae]|uniref:LapA family protein n=1 Tax=Erythrobacter crassostreae TaxID=2828328 RepID=A0A9X1F4V6_9SPHN|nr:LapA family protein [Erythrobacter crassostrea]MBV7260162.1 LapA family protein [Erythrobacter crassostrea]
MQIVRTLIWVLILFAILAFSFFNWQPVEVTLWDNLVLETKVPALVIIAFLLGLMPMWLFHRSVTWSLNRRIRSLENSVKSSALSRRHEPTAESSPVPPVTAAPSVVEKPVEKTVKRGDTLTPAEGTDG